jgi:hypothetical protein
MWREKKKKRKKALMDKVQGNRVERTKENGFC